MIAVTLNVTWEHIGILATILASIGGGAVFIGVGALKQLRKFLSEKQVKESEHQKERDAINEDIRSGYKHLYEIQRERASIATQEVIELKAEIKELKAKVEELTDLLQRTQRDKAHLEDRIAELERRKAM